MPSIRDMLHSRRAGSAVGFVLSCIGMYAFINIIPPSFINPINEHVARTFGYVLNALGTPVSVVNDTVSGVGLVFRIIPECTPIFTAALFICFLAFHPATIREKAAGIVMGIPALYLGNIVRLVATFLISRYNPHLFDMTHVYLGQVFTALMVIAACALWLKWIGKDAANGGKFAKMASFLARFTLISGFAFLVWIEVHHAYIRLLDRLMVLGFSLFAHHFTPARQTPVYYETFSMVTFTSLVLAIRSIPIKTRIMYLCVGLSFLFVTHLFHRIDNFLVVLFNYTGALYLDLTLLAIGQYLLPVLFLICTIYRDKQATMAAPKKTM